MIRAVECAHLVSQVCFCCHLIVREHLRNQASLTSLTVYKKQADAEKTSFYQ